VFHIYCFLYFTHTWVFYFCCAICTSDIAWFLISQLISQFFRLVAYVPLNLCIQKGKLPGLSVITKYCLYIASDAHDIMTSSDTISELVSALLVYLFVKICLNNLWLWLFHHFSLWTSSTPLLLSSYYISSFILGISARSLSDWFNSFDSALMPIHKEFSFPYSHSFASALCKCVVWRALLKLIIVKFVPYCSWLSVCQYWY